MSELANAMRLFSTARMSCAVQQVNYPMHKGVPNPSHGRFFFVGSVPMACMTGSPLKSLMFDTEGEALAAAVAADTNDVLVIQRADCSIFKKPQPVVSALWESNR